jgi:hypothetical protein
MDLFPPLGTGEHKSPYIHVFVRITYKLMYKPLSYLAVTR